MRSTNRVGGNVKPTVVVPRCFLDGEHTTDEIEVYFDHWADGEFVFDEDVVDATERIYLVNRIGC